MNKPQFALLEKNNTSFPHAFPYGGLFNIDKNLFLWYLKSGTLATQKEREGS